MADPRDRGQRRRKALAPILAAALLVTQQGFPFYAAAADVIEGPKAGPRIVVGSVQTPGRNLGAPASLPELNQTQIAGLEVGVANLGTSQIQNGAVPVLPGALPIAAESGAAGLTIPNAAAETPQTALAAPSIETTGTLASAVSVGRQADKAKDKPGAVASLWNRFFDRRAKTDAAADSMPLDPSGISVFLVRDGQPPASATLASLGELVRKDAAAALALNKNGKVLAVIDLSNPLGGVTKENVPAIKSLLEKQGITVQVQTERIAVDWAGQKHQVAGPAAAPAEGRGKAKLTLSRILTAPVREALFLGRTLKASFTAPIWSEVAGGVATKAFPFCVAVGAYWKMIGPQHPYLLAGSILLSLAMETFHGFFLNTWNNFQDNIRKLRGMNYQMYFSWLYMQGFGALFRLMSWKASPDKVVPPWHWTYWKDMIIMSVIGTVFGTLGYNGLNSLYNKGRIRRWQRSFIQQIRDLFFLAAGPLFATGSMHALWIMFAVQQSIDFILYLAGTAAKARPILLVADAKVAQTDEFKAKYPVGAPSTESPWKQAWSGLAGNPLIRLLTWPFRALYGVLRGKRR